MMPLTRRRVDAPHLESWQIFHDGLPIGSIGERAGVPSGSDRWGWMIGFNPGLPRELQRAGTAPTMAEARIQFQLAWREVLPTLPASAFDELRYALAHTAWKYAMWDAKLKMPTQTRDGRARCFCGTEIGIDCADHIRTVHLDMATRR